MLPYFVRFFTQYCFAIRSIVTKTNENLHVAVLVSILLKCKANVLYIYCLNCISTVTSFLL